MRYERIAITGENTQAGWPRLDAYLLDTTDENPHFRSRPAIVICPGGGYEFVSKREGEPVAMRFLAAGFHTFVLHYSVAPARFPTALMELAEAVKTVRENAADWKIADNRIFIMGFSAGGHLCATLGTLWNHPMLESAFGTAAGQKPWKPDGMLLCYPVLTMGEFTHAGSRANLLGEQPPSEILSLLSLETQVNETAVPAFLWHTEDDGAVPVENSLQYAAALRKAGVPFELHIYQTGPHGLSLCDETTSYTENLMVPDAAGWIDLAIAWVKRQGTKVR
jgi:acetyl esterase/lipase